MTRKRAIALIAVLVASVAFAGCLQSGHATPDEQDQPLHQAAVDDMAEADAYTMTMASTTETTVDGSVVQTQVEANATVDQADRRMQMVQTVTSDQPGQNQTVEMYLLNDSAYVEQDGSWRSMPLPMDPWENAGVQGNVELLQNATVTRVGNETIDGAETAALDVDVSAEQFKELSREQMGSLGQLYDLLTIESLSITQYVGTEEPHYVYGTDVEATMSLDAGGQSQTIETTQTVRFDDFEEDVSVDVPGELQERTGN